MSTPEPQFPGGEQKQRGPLRDPSELVHIPGMYPSIEAVEGLVATAVGEAKVAYDAKQEDKPPDLRAPLTENHWRVMSDVAGQVASWPDADVNTLAFEYDTATLDEDKLGQAERAYRGQLLAHAIGHFKRYLGIPEVAPHAEPLSMLVLRIEVAKHAFRLAYLAHFPLDEVAQQSQAYELVFAAEEAAGITETVMRRLTPGLPAFPEHG